VGQRKISPRPSPTTAAARSELDELLAKTKEAKRQRLTAKRAQELPHRRRLARRAVLVFDELSFVPFDREGGELLFNLLSARHGCSSTVITSKLDFSGWPHFSSGDEQLTAAVLDRLSEDGVVLTTKCQSCRQRKRR
jgi:DNA replication protein DnaC